MSLNRSKTLRTAEKHLSRGKVNAAIAEYRKLCDWDPTDLTTLNTLGDLYVRSGLNEEAARIFSRVAREYRHQGSTLKAIAILKKLLRIDPADLDSAACLAECYLEHGLRGEASRQYSDVADAYEHAGREDKALNAYQRMSEIDPSNTSAQMMLGERWVREGLWRRAHASFTAAGDQYSRQGADERALTAYLKARDVQPDEHKTLAAIASICTARGQADNAIPILRESLARNSSDAELHKLLGSTYLSAGRLAEAEQTFQELLALDADEYRNLLIVGEKFLEAGDLDRAVERIDGIVNLLIANRNEQEAVDFLRKVLDRDPDHPASLRMLALIFRRVREDFNLGPMLKALAEGALRRGDRDEAIEALKELCILEPHERAHRDTLQSLGIDAPEIPFALCSAAGNAWAYAVRDSSLSGYSRDAMALLESGPKDTLFELITADNRRRTARVSARVPLVVISDTGGWRESTETVDVAEAGLKLQLTHPAPPMTALRVLLEMAMWPEAVEKPPVMMATNGIVRYCKQRLGQSYLVGVDLRPMPEQPRSTDLIAEGSGEPV